MCYYIYVITLRIYDFCPPEICLMRELFLKFCTEEMQLYVRLGASVAQWLAC
jgi:hypothetical protein